MLPVDAIILLGYIVFFFFQFMYKATIVDKVCKITNGEAAIDACNVEVN